jgi:hypothetical protein
MADGEPLNRLRGPKVRETFDKIIYILGLMTLGSLCIIIAYWLFLQLKTLFADKFRLQKENDAMKTTISQLWHANAAFTVRIQWIHREARCKDAEGIEKILKIAQTRVDGNGLSVPVTDTGCSERLVGYNVKSRNEL